MSSRDDNDIRLVRATPGDRAQLFEFIRLAYGDEADYKVPERWDWQYVGNPLIKGPELPVWIAQGDDGAVGQMCATPVRVHVGGASYDAAWAVDLIVLPSGRGRGVGGRLHQIEVESFPMLMKLTMAHATRRMAERAGCVNLGTVYALARVSRPSADAVLRFLLAKTINRPKWHRLARLLCRYAFLHYGISVVARLALSLRDALSSVPRGDESVEVREVEEFGPEIDELWERLRGEYGIICHRDREFLNWRFRGYGRCRYRKFVAVRAGRVAGYTVLREREPDELMGGVVVDLLASRSDEPALRSLVAHALAFFGRRIASVECATTIPEYLAVLRRFGFRVTKRESPTCVVGADDELKSAVEARADQWFMSKADHDWDQLRPAPKL